MTTDQKTALATAAMLLEVEAVHIRPFEPFTLTSGRQSPIYVDCRKLISFPRVRRQLMRYAADLIQERVGYESLDVIAGGETAGIPFAAWIADTLMLPMAYVRKKPKGFGRNAQIEGVIAEGARVLLVEDLASDGGSKLSFCQAIRDAGAKIDHAFVIFFYDIYPGSREALQAEGITLLNLATWRDVLDVARRQERLTFEALSMVEAYLGDPEAWTPMT
ncbi:MAG: orotate phosphoribosyltransferase [Geminicoccaceae bacterium]